MGNSDIDHFGFSAKFFSGKKKVAGFCRFEGNGKICFNGVFCRKARCGINSAWNIEGNFYRKVGIYHFRDLIIGRAEFSGKAGSEKRVDYDIRSAEEFINFFAVKLEIQHGDSRLDNAVIHIFCFVASWNSAAENDYYICAFFKKFSCNDKTVAAVVSASAKNHKIASRNV